MRLLAILLLATMLPAQAATAVNYGNGCHGNVLLMSPPKLGTQVQFSVLNNGGDGLVGLGFTKVNMPLGGGCTLFVMPVWFLPFSNSFPNQPATFYVPNDRSLLGLTFYAQAVSLDRAIGWSNGIEGMIGH